MILFTGGCLLPGGVSGSGGCLVPGGVPGPGGGAWSRGGACSGRSGPVGGTWWRPPRRLLLRAVRILLECILVYCAFVTQGHFSLKKCLNFTYACAHR